MFCYRLYEMLSSCLFVNPRHQAGWFPFRAEQQNPRAEEGQQDEAEQNHDMQEMVSYSGYLFFLNIQY